MKLNNKRDGTGSEHHSVSRINSSTSLDHIPYRRPDKGSQVQRRRAQRRISYSTERYKEAKGSSNFNL